MSDTQKTTLYRLGLLALLVLAAYGATLSHGFVWDDWDIIVQNPLVQNLANIPRFFLSEDKVSAATGFYRPVTYISFALDWAIWGANPLGFNLTNLVLQVLAVLLFYGVVRELFAKERLALCAAALFALHPLAVETVNFHAGGRNTLLSACFALLSLLFYLRRGPLWSVFFFALAIFSKEFALLLPVVFLFCDLRVRMEKPRLERYLPYLAAVLGYLVLRSFAVEKANMLGSFRVSQQLWITPYLAIRYLVNMILPFRLKVMYDEQTSLTVCVLCLALVLLLAGALFVFRKKEQAELTLADFWFLLFLLPVVNLVPIVSNTLIADRYAYFSLMGFSLALASLLCRLKEGVGSACLALILAIFLPLDLSQSAVWKNEVTLFTRMAQDAPAMAIGPRNLAIHYYDKGDLAQAERYLLAACSRPDIQPVALVGAASMLWQAGKAELAEPLILKALTLDKRNPESYHLLGLIARHRGKDEQAQAYLAQGRLAVAGLEQQMARQAADFGREGEHFLVRGRFAQAENMLKRALSLDANSVPALAGMAGLNLERGDVQNAATYLGRAAGLDPGYPSLHLYRSRLYQREGKKEEARAEMELFRQSSPPSATRPPP